MASSSSHLRVSQDTRDFVSWLTRKFQDELRPGYRLTAGDVVEEAVDDYYAAELQEFRRWDEAA